MHGTTSASCQKFGNCTLVDEPIDNQRSPRMNAKRDDRGIVVDFTIQKTSRKLPNCSNPSARWKTAVSAEGAAGIPEPCGL